MSNGVRDGGAHIGEFSPGELVTFKFFTCDNTGAPTTLSGTPVISVYKDSSTTQDTDGVTLSVDFDGVTGLNNVEIDTNDDTTFYSSGSDFSVVITTGTVNAVSAVGSVVKEFSIQNRIGKEILDNVENLALGGVAINTVAGSANIDWGTQTSGTYASTATNDGTRHVITSATNLIDIQYDFDIGADGVPVGLTFDGYLEEGAPAGGDSVNLQVYNWVTTSYDVLDTTFLTGVVAGVDIAKNATLFTSHVGTGANDGVVRVRFYGSSLEAGTTLEIDQLYVSYAIVRQTVGYALGRIWIDTNASNTNTTDFVDGTADNPVSTVAAATTLATSLGMNSFNVAPGSSITLAASLTDKDLSGSMWDLALGGQDISGSHIAGASVTGIASGSTQCQFNDCHMGSCTIPPATIHTSSIDGTITVASAGDYFLHNCYSGIAGTATPALDFGAAIGNTNMSWRNYSGGIEVQNMGNTGTDTMSLEGRGQLVLNANCDGGSISIRGLFKVTDNSGNVTLNDSARFDSVDLVDDIWDEDIFSSHNTNHTAGKTLKEGGGSLITADDAVSATSNSITLAASASVTDGAYDPALIFIHDGKGAGQCRLIMEYVGATKTAYIDRDWKDTPDNTSEYHIVAHPGREHVNEGLATGGGASTITLNTLASSVDNAYVGQYVFIRAGTGADQVRRVASYVGSTRVATMSRPWATAPDTNSVYAMIPTGAFSDACIATAVWDAQTSSYADVGSTGEAVVNTDANLVQIDGTANASATLNLTAISVVNPVGTAISAIGNTNGIYAAGSSNGIFASASGSGNGMQMYSTSGRGLYIAGGGSESAYLFSAAGTGLKISGGGSEGAVDIDNSAGPGIDIVGSTYGIVALGTSNAGMVLQSNDKGLSLEGGSSDLTLGDTGTVDGNFLSAAAVDVIWDELTSGHTDAGSTGKAVADGALAGYVGDILFTWTEYEDGHDGDPAYAVADVTVSVFNNANATGSPITSKETDEVGEAKLYLDAGTYYLFRTKAGRTFTNPATITVS